MPDFEINGVTVRASSREKAEAYMAQQQAAQVQNAYTAGEANPRGNPLWDQYIDSLPPLAQYGLSVVDYVRDRIPGMQGIEPDYRQQAEDRSGAFLAGQIAPPTAAAMAGGASIYGQAAIAGVLEGLSSDATAGSVAQEAGLAAIGQSVGNLATRVVSGIGAGISAIRGGQAVKPTSRALQTIAETGLGRNFVNEANDRAVTGTLSRLLKVKVTREGLRDGSVWRAASQKLGGMFDDALKIDSPVDASDVAKYLDNPDITAWPGRTRTVAKLTNRMDGQRFRAAHKAIREQRALMMAQDNLAAVDELDAALDMLNQKGAAAGADLPLLSEASQRWRAMSTLRDASDNIWQGDGPLPFRSINTRLTGNQGFGRNAKELSDKLIPDVRDAIQTTRKAVNAANIVGDSGTAARLTNIAGGVGGGTLALTGQLSPEAAALGLGLYGVASPVASAAAIGAPFSPVGNVLNVAARELADKQ